MTLIIALPCTDGIALASDSQITTGLTRSRGQKINRLNDHVLWAASGELALIQRVKERLDGLPGRDQPLPTQRDNLASVIKECVEQLLNLDFRTQFLRGDPNALLNLHPGDFLFAEWTDKARILHILPNGTPEWVEAHCAITGSGDMFAHALLQKYELCPITLEKGKLLAYKVMEEAIHVGSWGLDFPIDIWVVTPAGASQSPKSEIDALQDAAEVLRRSEVDMLVSPPPLPELQPAPIGDPQSSAHSG